MVFLQKPKFLGKLEYGFATVFGHHVRIHPSKNEKQYVCKRKRQSNVKGAAVGVNFMATHALTASSVNLRLLGNSRHRQALPFASVRSSTNPMEALMTASSKPKTRKTRCIAAAVATALALSSCAISDFSVNIGEVNIEFGAAAPAPKPELQLKPQPAKERVSNRLG
jgi:hypothetical protein